MTRLVACPEVQHLNTSHSRLHILEALETTFKNRQGPPDSDLRLSVETSPGNLTAGTQQSVQACIAIYEIEGCRASGRRQFLDLSRILPASLDQSVFPEARCLAHPTRKGSRFRPWQNCTPCSDTSTARTKASLGDTTERCPKDDMLKLVACTS